MYFLNTNQSYLLYQSCLPAKVFVDKSLMIEKISQHIGVNQGKYICITRPRRFGKTINANMLAAYYGKAVDSSKLFEDLKISKSSMYPTHLNTHNVIHIYMTDIVDTVYSYDEFKKSLEFRLIDDILKAYSSIEKTENKTIADYFIETRDKFIFIIDEWDSIFQKDYMNPKYKLDYLTFFKTLLKDRPYVELAYMTGVLPIAKYSSGSALNMFREYSFMNDNVYSSFFGFTEEEVQELCIQHNFSYDEICDWYNGYYDMKGHRIFNPRSVSCAITDNICQSYWTNTGPVDEVSWYIQNNTMAIRDDIIKMVSHEPVRIRFRERYSAEDLSLNTREEILSAMVVYGFLSYHDGYLSIPNKELMIEFDNALRKDSMQEVAKIVERSDRMLDATFDQDIETMCDILEQAHDNEIPILQYNDENSLACVITLVYLSARETYRIEREEKSDKGYADFIFHSRKNGYPDMILELKVDSTPEAAIEQIKMKNYLEKTTGNVLLIGISYSRKTKMHQIKIEEA